MNRSRSAGACAACRSIYFIKQLKSATLGTSHFFGNSNFIVYFSARFAQKFVNKVLTPK